MYEDAILPEIAMWPLLMVVILFVAVATYYCVKTEIKNRKIGASKVDVEAAEDEVVVKNISGKLSAKR